MKQLCGHLSASNKCSSRVLYDITTFFTLACKIIQFVLIVNQRVNVITNSGKKLSNSEN